MLGGVLPPLGVVPVGLGDGVGHCPDVTNLPRVRLFIFLLYFGRKTFNLFFKGYGFVCFCTAGYASS